MKKLKLYLACLCIGTLPLMAQMLMDEIPVSISQNCDANGLTVDHCFTSDGEEMGHDYVDLGLSVKWATTNVGATNPEDGGAYYAWGETVSNKPIIVGKPTNMLMVRMIN